MGPILCFTLRDQSYISKVPDPEKAFNMLILGRVRVHGKKAESDPFPGGMPTLGGLLFLCLIHTLVLGHIWQIWAGKAFYWSDEST